MTDQPAPTTADIVPPSADVGEDSVLPAAVYVLYIVGLFTGLTILVGLILAYLMKGTAGPKAATHYAFLIRTVWISLALFVIGGLLTLFGGILSIILIGIPALALGLFILGTVWIWFAVRCGVGLVYLGRGEAYPRPNTWLA